jgi:hypothetical protein
MAKKTKAVPYYPDPKDQSEIRYFLVDAETGEILDNANGYGFKTAKGAHVGYSMRSKHGSKKE